MKIELINSTANREYYSIHKDLYLDNLKNQALEKTKDILYSYLKTESFEINPYNQRTKIYLDIDNFIDDESKSRIKYLEYTINELENRIVSLLSNAR